MRGRPAALPPQDEGHRRPPVVDASQLIVRHLNEKGDGERFYDFGRLPVAEPMQRSLAVLFARRVGTEGPWRNLDSSREGWTLLGTFCRFLSQQDAPPRDLPELTAAHWAAWQVSRPRNSMGHHQISKVAAFLRDEVRLPAATLTSLPRRGRPKEAVRETAYTPEEFEQIRTAATRSFRAALHRIRDNQQHLQQWREGRFAPRSDPWLVGEALEELARTGDVPHYHRADGIRTVSHRHARALGGWRAEFTWHRLYLTSREAVSLIVLLIAAHGWNATSVSELGLPSTYPDPGLDGTVVYRLELEKRRRRPPHRYETRNLADWGAASPGRLITHAIEATGPARSLLAATGAPTGRLVVWHAAGWPNGTQDTASMFRVGLTNDTQIRGWDLGPHPRLNLRRLRKTVVGQHHRSATQHSQDTHDSVYVLPDPQTRERAIPVISQGIAEALEHARATFRARLEEDAAGADTVTACCTDYTHSPFSPHGSPCRASFLLCTACPNAVVTKRHLPRLARLHQVLDALRGVVPAAVWDHEWREHFERLADLKATGVTAGEWTDALSAVTAGDRSAIDQLLHRRFDT